MGAEVSQQPEQAGPDGGAGPVVAGIQPPTIPLVAPSTTTAPMPPVSAPQPPGTVRVASGNGNQEVSEGVLLSQLVQLLHQRPRFSLLLSDLGALLPQSLRSGVKEKGGLRSWLQKHPMLFSVTGQPGKESVTLTLGGNQNTSQEPSGGMPTEQRQASAKDEKAKKDEEDEDTASCVQLRGLPYRATVADVRTFLGRHTAFLKDEHAIQLVLNRDGRPSGFARVLFRNPNAARSARDELHNAVMTTLAENGTTHQDRYVEIFLYSERPNKLKFRKGIVSDGSPPEEEPDIQGMSKEQVIQECREHMMTPGKSQLLLSMLGVALSPASRHYLKKTDLGLKHFLAQYPQEFGVEGAKGREQITYLPAMPQGYTMDCQQPPAPAPAPAPSAAPPQSVAADTGKGRKQRGGKGTPGPVSGNINDLTHKSFVEDTSPLGLTSPHRMPVSPGIAAARGMNTPSDWGTPMDHSQYEPWELPRKTKATETPKATPNDAFFAPGRTPNVFETPNWALWGVPPWGISPGTSPFGAAPTPPWLIDTPMSVGAVGGLHSQMAELLAGMQQPPGIYAGTQPGTMQPPGIGQHFPSQELHEQGTSEREGGSVGSVALRLRGLPYNSSEQDIFAFFAKHDMVEHIADVTKAVKLLPKANGKASGHAIVEMCSRESADLARAHINGQWMGQRYVEVFYNDEFERNEASEGIPLNSYQTTADESMEMPSISDTGGSGGMTAMTAPTTMPWQSPQPWGASSPGVENFMAMAQASRAEAMRQTAGGTGGEAMLKDQGESSWEALFDFLKRDNMGDLPPPDRIPPSARNAAMM